MVTVLASLSICRCFCRRAASSISRSKNQLPSTTYNGIPYGHLHRRARDKYTCLVYWRELLFLYPPNLNELRTFITTSVVRGTAGCTPHAAAIRAQVFHLEPWQWLLLFAKMSAWKASKEN